MPAVAGTTVRTSFPCCSSSGSAIPVRAMPATGTISVSWWSTRSPGATASRPWRRRFQGVSAEGPLGGERVLLLLPGTYMNESGPRGGGGRAFLQARARRHRGVPRRDRPRARQGAGQDRRRRRRPQRPAFDLGACRQRLPARAHRRRTSRRARIWCMPTCSTTSPRTSGHGSRRLCDIIADNAEPAGERSGRELPEQGAPRACRPKGSAIKRRTPDAPARRTIESACADRNRTQRDIHGIQMRHRRPAQCRQVDALQRADRDRGGAGGELSVLHHRAECRRGGGAGSAARRACDARRSRPRSCRRG